jgi:hypothetical protein
MSDGNGLGDLAAALAKAQAAFPKVLKDREAKIESTRGRYSYRYADLATLLEAVRPGLTANGLALVQPIEVSEHGMVLHTMLLHVSGAHLDSYYPLAAHERPQEMGSEITYSRRYAASAILGVASEDDDDGQAAQGANGKSQPRAAAATTEADLKPRNLPAAQLDAEVAQAFPKDLKPVTVDARELWKKDVRDCPVCGTKGSLRKGAKQYGGGVYCDRNQGCGYKWKDTPPWKPEIVMGSGEGNAPQQGAASAPRRESDVPREHLIAMIRQTVKALAMSTKELQALKDAYTAGKIVDDATDEQLEHLYLFLGDGEAVSQWRAQVAA